MQPREEGAADWRDAAAYAPLLKADRAFHAWEWLRRCPCYREAASRHLSLGGRPAAGECPLPDPAYWGLHGYEAASLPVPQARPVWRADVYPYVLRAHARGCGASGDRFDLARFKPFATIAPATDGGEHLLLSDGLRSVRIDLGEGSVRLGPVRLSYQIRGIESAEAPLLTLRRLLALCRSGRFSAALHSSEARAGRLILMLRAYDAMLSGASQREMAGILLSSESTSRRWRVEAPTLRLQVQRLVRSARAMAGGGYLRLLRR